MSSQGHRCQSWGVGGRAPRFWDGNRGGVVGSPRNIIIAYNLQELGTILCKHLKAYAIPRWRLTTYLDSLVLWIQSDFLHMHL